MKKLKRLSALLMCASLCLCLLPAYAENYMAKNYVVYQSPNPQSTVVCSVMRGTKATGILGNTNDGWTKISFSMGASNAKGWIYQAAFTGSGDFSAYPPDDSFEDGSSYSMDRLFLQIVTDEGIKTSSSGGVLGTEEMDEYKTVGVNVSANLYSVPSFSGEVLGTYTTGASVHLLRKSAFFDSNGGFYYVSIAGLKGFMSSSAFIDRTGPGVTETPAPTHFPTVPPSYGTQMYVQTGNPGKLYLRAQPYKNASVIGKYPNGTSVFVYSIQNGWASVRAADGTSGYMMSKFLTTEKPGGGGVAPQPTSGAFVIRYVQTGNPGKLYLRKNPWPNAAIIGKYPNGTAVGVYSTSDGWSHVAVEGQTGYMMSKFLTGYQPPVTPVPTMAPTAAPTVPPSASVIAVMYVNTGNSGRLHLRSSNDISSHSLGLYYNGTQADVFAFLGDWAYVRVNGRTGYMMTKFLSYTKPVPTVRPTVPPSGGSDEMTVRTGNTGKLHLRAAPSKHAASLGLYPNGTRVKVHSYYYDWAQVSVYGQNGFMMKKFLAVPGSGGGGGGYVPENRSAVVVHPRGSYVNLRSSMTAESGRNILMRVTSGSIVWIQERIGGWCKVNYSGMEGYMMSAYLQ